ncbi:MAG: flgE [Rickettsiaceae bacterium]|jgi:flagellar hook protein FlgE|nr:flgE [Rickettsiaceae bacterium]
MLEKKQPELNYFVSSYNSDGGSAGKNIAEGSLIHDSVYVRPITVYDSLGVLHNCRVGFAKLDNNTWAVEIFAAKEEDGTYDIETTRADGQIAAGTLRFNGDGSLAYVSQSLKNPIEIVWKNYAFNSSIEFDWGTAGVPCGTEGATTFGKQDGMRQVASPFDQRFLDQNGIQPGVLRNLEIDKNGTINAYFSNGGTTKCSILPNTENPYISNNLLTKLVPANFESQNGSNVENAFSKLNITVPPIATTLVHLGITLNAEAPIVEAADISLLSPEGLNPIGATQEVSETY